MRRASAWLKRARGAGAGLVAREVALELSDGSFRPDEAEHVPGVGNSLAATQSRRFQATSSPWRVPLILRTVPEVTVPRRDEKWYRTLTPPNKRT